MIPRKQGERDVPCNGCTACCRAEFIQLHPECGDDISKYITEPAINPFTREPVLMLKHKPNNGACIYLGETGCTIHAERPYICRSFDCRLLFLRATAKEQREKKGKLGERVMEEGRKRLHTLSAADLKAFAKG